MLQVTQGLFEFKRKESGHTGVQQGPQVRQMVMPLHMGGQKTAGKFQGFFHIFQRFNLHSRQRVDNGQEIGGIGEPHLGIRAKRLKRLLILSFNL